MHAGISLACRWLAKNYFKGLTKVGIDFFKDQEITELYEISQSTSQVGGGIFLFTTLSYTELHFSHGAGNFTICVA